MTSPISDDFDDYRPHLHPAFARGEALREQACLVLKQAQDLLRSAETEFQDAEHDTPSRFCENMEQCWSVREVIEQCVSTLTGRAALRKRKAFLFEAVDEDIAF